MNLYNQWLAIVRAPRNHEEQQAFWENYYYRLERPVYVKILESLEKPYAGKLAELAKIFELEETVFCGVVSGMNTSLKAGEYDLETLDGQSMLNLEVDVEKLYANMIAVKASWLHMMPLWHTILSEEKRNEIAKRFIDESVLVAQAPQNCCEQGCCGHAGGCASHAQELKN